MRERKIHNHILFFQKEKKNLNLSLMIDIVVILLKLYMEQRTSFIYLQNQPT